MDKFILKNYFLTFIFLKFKHLFENNNCIYYIYYIYYGNKKRITILI